MAKANLTINRSVDKSGHKLRSRLMRYSNLEIFSKKDESVDSAVFDVLLLFQSK